MTDEENTRKRLGDFEIIRELGRGGMGIVYEARQVSLNRKVALKVISGSLGLSSKAVLRFQREAEAAGKLHHTNIVPIYATGNDDGAHYYAMELIDGPSLHQVIRSLRSGDRKSTQLSGSAATMAVGTEPAVSTDDSVLESSSGAVETPAWVCEILGSPPVPGESTPAPESNAGAGSTSPTSSGGHLSSGYFDCIATMIAGVAAALAYAHENGVIHRDIKPANLLLSKDGRVSINDFGLARMLEQPGMTMSGEFVGSPLYMSPEQITAGRAPLDHRTDIYSLGATLYELLTLKPPFPGKSRDEVIAQIIHKEPAPLRRQTPKVPVDLETICLKAMEKDPDRRYQTAGQLAEDLRRFVDRHAISARRIGTVERAVRWGRRNKALTAMACLTLTVCVTAAAYVYLAGRRQELVRAMDRGLIAALSGDSATAVVEIEKAGVLGAESSWVNMLLGQVDLFEGRPHIALSKFKAAAEDAPESVMARAMVASAYLANGLWDEYAKAMDALERLRAEQGSLSAEELLFVGIAAQAIAPERSLQVIDAAVRTRSSFTLAKIWQARVRTAVAQTRGDKDLALEALNALEGLSWFDPELVTNPLFAEARLNARLTAYRFCARAGDRAQAQTHLDEAGRSDVQTLAMSPQFLSGNYTRSFYYEFTKDFDALSRVMNEVATIRNPGYSITPYAAAHFGLGRHRLDEALRQIRAIRDQGDPYVVWARTVLLSETLEGRRSAVELLKGSLASYPRDSENIEDVFSVLFLRWERDEAIDYVSERARTLEETQRAYLEINRASLDFLSDGKTTRNDLLSRFGDSELARAGAYFVVGLRQLTRGDRPAAKKSFQVSAESLCFGHPSSAWSRAFATRMNEDEAWPEWLPTEPVDSSVK